MEPSRIAHVEHTFKVPGRSAPGRGRQSAPGRGGHEEEKESAAAGQRTRQATGSSSGGGGRGRDISRATTTSALVGRREPSEEAKQSVADEDEAVGIEDLDEVNYAGRVDGRAKATRAIVANKDS